MAKNFREHSLDQRFLMPPDLREWLPEGHLALFVSDVVETLDLREIMKAYEKDETRGGAAYHPVMLVKLVVYAYCVGVPSSRRIERATSEDVGFRVLAGNQHPDHDTIASFRRRFLNELSGLFVQVLTLCQRAGLVKLGHVAIDGTKVKANASKHKAMSYARMKLAEADLEAQVKQLMAEAERVDREEDAKYGRGKRGDELPAELARRESRLQKIREAKEALEREAHERAAAKEEKDGDSGPGTSSGTKVEERQATPADKAQRNFTDPESRIMKDGATKSFEQAYNAQVGVDSKAQVIVAAEVTQNANDKNEFLPVLREVKENTGRLPRKVSADSGYFNEAALCDEETNDVDLYVPPDRHRHSQPMPVPKATGDNSFANRMRRKIRTARGEAVYRRRKAIVEPVIGQIKEARKFRRFSFRGLNLVRAEWKLVCLTHNILKLFRYSPARFQLAMT